MKYCDKDDMDCIYRIEPSCECMKRTAPCIYDVYLRSPMEQFEVHESA